MKTENIQFYFIFKLQISSLELLIFFGKKQFFSKFVIYEIKEFCVHAR